jgi:hypothetical protein
MRSKIQITALGVLLALTVCGLSSISAFAGSGGGISGGGGPNKGGRTQSVALTR